MNRPLKYIRLLIVSLVLFYSSGLVLSQSELNDQKIRSLQETIEAIESNSDYVFNYDPSLLDGYEYEGRIDLSDINAAFDQVFYDSPFLYTIEGGTILVYYPSPRTYRICGTLIDANSKEPLIAANITVMDSMLGTQSDASGYFELECTADKNQRIEISYLGYQAIQFYLQDIKDQDCETWNMEINQDLFGGEIIIRDYLIDGISLGEDFTSFNLDFNQLSKNHSTVEHDILKTAQLLPGINSIDDSATNLQIRGSNPGQNLVLWEGVPLYNAGHVFGMISAINPFSVDKVNIYKGAYDPKYDNRVGGILNISLAEELADGFHGSAGTTLTEFHGHLSIPLIKDQISFEVAGRQTINGLFNSPTLQSYTDKVFQFSIIDDQKNEAEPLRTEQTLNYSDWNAKLIYRPSDRFMVSGGVYRNAQDFSYSFWLDQGALRSDDLINLKTQIISLGTELEVTKNWTSKLSFYQSSYDNNYEKSEIENAIKIYSNDQLNSVKEQSLTFSNDLHLSDNILMNIGYEYNIKDVELDLGDELNFDSEFIPLEFEKASFQNLFQSFRYIKNNLQIDAGNRSSYYQEVDGWFHSPRINIKYTLGENLNLKADAGIYHQFISQLTNVGADQIKVDNPLWILNASEESLSQKANKIAAGFVYQKGKWLLDIEAYANTINNITTIGPQLEIIADEIGFSSGTSKVTGIDFLLKKRWSSGFNTWLSYSLGMANYKLPGVSDESFPAPNDIRHNLSLVSSYKFKGFQFALNTNYHSGLPFSQGQLTLNEDDPNPEPPFLYFVGYDSFNEGRLNPYIRLDFNAAYRFDVNRNKGSQIEISCSLINLLNRTNNIARGYFVDYNETTEIYKLLSAQKSLLNRTALLLIRFYW